MLRDVRDAVEDWDGCRPRPSRSSPSSRRARRRCPTPSEIEQGRAFLHWLADDHFAFLGYREYHLESAGDDELLRAVPGTGLGILRADQDQSAAFGKLPDAAKAKAREKTLLVLAKANSNATVHRPAYLDYVGVKTLRRERRGHRRAPLPRPARRAPRTPSRCTRIPVLREKAAEVLERSASTRAATPARA